MSADTVVSPINQLPTGLLGLLGTQALGQNPNELLQAVRPVVDLMPFWASGTAVQIATSVGTPVTLHGPSNVAGLVITVPSGKRWMPLSFTVVAQSIGAGDTGRVRPAIFAPGAVPSVTLELGDNSGLQSAFGGTHQLSWFNFWSQPLRTYGEGTIFGVYVEAVTVVITGLSIVPTLKYLEF